MAETWLKCMETLSSERQGRDTNREEGRQSDAQVAEVDVSHLYNIILYIIHVNSF